MKKDSIVAEQKRRPRKSVQSFSLHCSFQGDIITEHDNKTLALYPNQFSIWTWKGGTEIANGLNFSNALEVVTQNYEIWLDNI